jgi:hypothetical protein
MDRRTSGQAPKPAAEADHTMPQGMGAPAKKRPRGVRGTIS